MPADHDYESPAVPGQWYAVLFGSPGPGQRLTAGPFDTQGQAAAWRDSTRPVVRVVRGATVVLAAS